MNRLLFAFLFFAASQVALAVDPAADIFRKANQAYQDKDFATAIEGYEQLLASDIESAEVEYNLANAYFRTNAYGQAVLHYERALLLTPGDEDIQHNLALTRQQLVDDIEVLPEFFLTKWWNAMRSALPATGWGILALLLWWIGVGGFCYWLIGKSRAEKKKGFLIGVVGVLLCILPFALAFSRQQFDEHSRLGIVLEHSTELRSAPDSGGKEVTTIHEGLKVKLLDQLGGWWKVQLPNGEQGWLSEGVVEEI